MALVMVLILATLIASCRSEPEASFVIGPTPEAIYESLEPAFTRIFARVPANAWQLFKDPSEVQWRW